MGCGACAMAEHPSHHESLHHRLLNRIARLKKHKIVPAEGGFVSREQVKIIENSLVTLSDVLPVEATHRFEAGQTSLLTQERRIAWKLALQRETQPNEVFNALALTTNIQTKNETTEKRLYEVSLDVKRTFPETNQLNRDNLSLILENITLFFEGVGYTQGMNFIAGFFLLCGFTPAETFQIFVRLAYHPCFLLIRNFSQNFMNVNTCIKVMEKVIDRGSNETLKEVKARIQETGMNFMLFVFSWFLTHFLYNFNLKSCVLIWDHLILSSTPSEQEHQQFDAGQFGCGLVSSIDLALRIVQEVAPQILECEEINQIMQVLRHDQIALRIDEATIHRILEKCRSQPLLDWQQFNHHIQETDPQMHQYIGALTSRGTNPAERDSFLSFMSSCRYPKRP